MSWRGLQVSIVLDTVEFRFGYKQVATVILNRYVYTVEITVWYSIQLPAASYQKFRYELTLVDRANWFSDVATWFRVPLPLGWVTDGSCLLL